MAERYLAFAAFARERPGRWSARFGDLARETGYPLVETTHFVAIVEGRSLEICHCGVDGLIVGALFRCGERRATESLTAAEGHAIIASAGQALIDQFWGSYVALLGSPDGPAAIVRAPMGDLACYYWRCPNGVLLASDPALLFRALGVRPTIDWQALARHLIAPNLCRPQTCLGSVLELAGGERLPATAQAHPEPLWTPWAFVAAERRLDDKRSATERVREAILTSVAARASCYERTVLLLSGGLDSSIIAAALADANHDFAALNMVTHARGGDERDYARSVAAHCGFPLHEVTRETAAVDVERSAASDLPYPNERSFAQATRNAADALAQQTSASAIVNGGGGDNIFCSLQSAAPLADLVRTRGLTRSAIALTDNLATVAQATHAAVVRQAIARLAWRSPRYRWKAETDLLSGEALLALDTALDHPWLDPPRGALSGSAGQIGLLLAAFSLVQSPGATGPHPWRSVLLAQPIVEACLSVPTWFWFERGRNRAIARHAFAPLLPETIAWRPSKGAMDSFVVEIFDAHRARLTAMILDGRLATSGLIDRPAVERILRSEGPVRGMAYSRIMQFADVEAWLACWTDRAG